MNTTDILDYYNAYLSRMLPQNRHRVSWALQQLAEFMPQPALNTKGTTRPGQPEQSSGKRP